MCSKKPPHTVQHGRHCYHVRTAPLPLQGAPSSGRGTHPSCSLPPPPPPPWAHLGLLDLLQAGGLLGSHGGSCRKLAPTPAGNRAPAAQGRWRRRRRLAAAGEGGWPCPTPAPRVAASCMHHGRRSAQRAAGSATAAMLHGRLGGARIPACNPGPLLQVRCRRVPPIGIAAGGAMHALPTRSAPCGLLAACCASPGRSQACWRAAATDPPSQATPAAAALPREPYVGDWRRCGDCSAAQRS